MFSQAPLYTDASLSAEKAQELAKAAEQKAVKEARFQGFEEYRKLGTTPGFQG